jgi:hypothetical protein
VIVTNPDGLSATLPDGFTVLDAAIFDQIIHLPLLARTWSAVGGGAALGSTDSSGEAWITP